MKKYRVFIPVEDTVYIDVEAESEEAAIREADEQTGRGTPTTDLEEPSMRGTDEWSAEEIQ